MFLSAYSNISGNSDNPMLHGKAYFYTSSAPGVWIEVEVYGLPVNNQFIDSGIYGLHIHENGDCTPPFSLTGSHYNPNNLPHPYHSGDLPSLLSSNGYAYMFFYTNRFTIKEIIGRSIIIHSKPDDFNTQPAGNSGDKIACGVIKKA